MANTTSEKTNTKRSGDYIEVENSMEGITNTPGLTVKASLEKQDGNPEIRRFLLSGDLTYQKLTNKLTKIFHSLENFQLYWTDTDGDSIICSSNEELRLAINNLTDDVFRLKIQRSAEPVLDDVHPYVICDGCRGHVAGSRYKCLRCADYDLCRQCEGAAIHSHHPMVRLNRPLGAKPLHPGCFTKRTGRGHCRMAGPPLPGDHQDATLSIHQVAPFPCWPGMMNRLWQNRARQVWMQAPLEQEMGEEAEKKMKRQWMVLMQNAWKELAGEQSEEDRQCKRRWRQTVVHCCDKLKKQQQLQQSDEQPGEEIGQPEDMNKKPEDQKHPEGEVKQEELKVKRRQWRQTMRQCWREVENNDKKQVEKQHGQQQQQQPADGCRRQWQQMMRQMMPVDGTNQLSGEEIREKRRLMKQWWRQLRQNTPGEQQAAIASDSSNFSDSSDVGEENTKPMVKIGPSTTSAKPTVGVAKPGMTPQTIPLTRLRIPVHGPEAVVGSRPACRDPRFLGPPLRAPADPRPVHSDAEEDADWTIVKDQSTH